MDKWYRRWGESESYLCINHAGVFIGQPIDGRLVMQWTTPLERGRAESGIYAGINAPIYDVEFPKIKNDTEVWYAVWNGEDFETTIKHKVLPRAEAIVFCNTHRPRVSQHKHEVEATWDLVDVWTGRLISHLAWLWELSV